jgi:hypothetical protein
MKRFRSTRAQSAVEFAMILPAFILTTLGLIQLGLIYINVMMLKYTAYMTARVACVYEEEEERDKNAGRAHIILKMMQASADKYDKNVLANVMDGLIDVGQDAVASYLQGDELEITNEEFEGAKGGYIKVTVVYNMPLKVPFVNKVFGMLQNKNRWDVINARTAAAYAGFPYYTLRSSSIMRMQ